MEQQTYKYDFLCCDIMMDPVSSAGVKLIVTFGGAFARGVAGVVAHEPRASDDQVQQKA